MSVFPGFGFSRSLVLSSKREPACIQYMQSISRCQIFLWQHRIIRRERILGKTGFRRWRFFAGILCVFQTFHAKSGEKSVAFTRGFCYILFVYLYPDTGGKTQGGKNMERNGMKRSIKLIVFFLLMLALMAGILLTARLPRQISNISEETIRTTRRVQRRRQPRASIPRRSLWRTRPVPWITRLPLPSQA